MAWQLELIPFPVSVVLVIGKEDWKKVCEENDLENRSWLPTGVAGEVQSEDDQILVRLRDDVTHEHIDIIAHESTHIFQAMCNFIQEQDRSVEFEAYYIGFFSKWIYDKLKEHQCSSTGDNSSSSEPSLPSQVESPGTSQATDEPKPH